MKNEDAFVKICYKDIEEIYDILGPFLPSFDIMNFEQSIIYENDKKILSRFIKNDIGEKIGQEVVIHLYDTDERIRLIRLNSIISLEKTYYSNNNKFQEKVCISFDNCFIKRYFSYDNSYDVLNDKENYNILSNYGDYLDSPSINDIMNKLKCKSKVKKRI